MKKIQKVEYIFELNDMFIFQKGVGTYHKGDYIIISKISDRLLSFITADTVNGSYQVAAGDIDWMSKLLNEGSLSYEGTLVK